MVANIFRGELADTGDSGDLQLAKVLGYAGEELTKVHRVMPFGLASRATKGSHGIGLALRGHRDLAVILGHEDPANRQKNLGEGETVIYDVFGQF